MTEPSDRDYQIERLIGLMKSDTPIIDGGYYWILTHGTFVEIGQASFHLGSLENWDVNITQGPEGVTLVTCLPLSPAERVALDARLRSV